jgi:glucosamine kinase
MALKLPYSLGIDGGGTNCRARLRDASGKLLAEAHAGPANMQLGLDVVASNVLQSANNAFAAAGLAPAANKDTLISAGIAGNIGETEEMALRHTLQEFASVHITTDAEAALWGAFAGGNGAVAIFGTGSIGCMRKDDQIQFVGGWGFLVGDDGSGAALGRSAVRNAINASDGMAEITPLSAAVIAQLGGKPATIVRWASTAKPADYASLAPLIFQYAKDGDDAAITLLKDLARDMQKLISRLKDIGAIEICLLGGLSKAMTQWLPCDEGLRPPIYDPVDGAIIAAGGRVESRTGVGWT